MKKRVYIDGIFDLFHRGHLESFNKTKNCLENEDVTVIVGVVSDADAENYKRLPIIRENDRVAIIKGLSVVDQVIFPAPLIITKKFIDDNKIDMIVHGFVNEDDYQKQKEFFDIPIKLNKFKTIDYYTEISTSDIIKNIKENY
jgi:choline-phosphate cytidylyltransferase